MTHTRTRTETTTAVTTRIRWEAAHRLPQLIGKCQSLHGHSWQAWVTVSGPVLGMTGAVVDMSAVKTVMQDWVDKHWDHATLLGLRDPLRGALLDDPHLRVFTFGLDHPSDRHQWPTVENVAAVLRLVAVDLLEVPDRPGITVRRVVVAETENNRAEVGT